MLANTISCSSDSNKGRKTTHPNFIFQSTCPWFTLICLAAVCLPLAIPISSQTPPSQQRARQALEAARQQYESDRSSVEAAWRLGRAAYDLADLADDKDERKAMADLGIDACRQAIAHDPDAAPAHYYLALNLGQLAQVKRFSALKLLHQMEHALLTAQKIDPKLDYAGPDRSLGMLYLEAPPYPISVGSRSEARNHLQAAVRLSPEFPENRICLAEAYARWGEARNLETELGAIEKLLPDARTRFDEAKWHTDWHAWEQRLAKLLKAHDRLDANPKVSSSERGAKTPR